MLVHIRVRDVPDLPPQFTRPSKNNLVFDFLENQLGPVVEVKAVSKNLAPLGDIQLRIVSVSPFEMAAKFVIEKSTTTTDNWILKCIDKITLKNDGNDELIE